jgi:hypothetical protein
MKICICNNCGTLIHDHNPSNRSYDFTESDLRRYHIEDMKPFEEDGEQSLGCPECKTDGYLRDIESLEQLPGEQEDEFYYTSLLYGTDNEQ